MARADLTDLTIVLDRSGSMEAMRAATIDAFNSFLLTQRDGAGDARLSLVQFDDQYEPVYTGLPLTDVPPLTTETFEPRGSTALLDAVVRTIDETGERLARLPEAERPGSVLVAILTDGQENSSTRFTIQDVNARISHQRTVYSWQFVFLAANQDAIATAAGLGLDAAQSLTFGATPEGMKRSARIFSNQVLTARSKRMEADTVPSAPLEIAFSPEDRADAMAGEPSPPTDGRLRRRPSGDA